MVVDMVTGYWCCSGTGEQLIEHWNFPTTKLEANILGFGQTLIESAGFHQLPAGARHPGRGVVGCMVMPINAEASGTRWRIRPSMQYSQVKSWSHWETQRAHHPRLITPVPVPMLKKVIQNISMPRHMSKQARICPCDSPSSSLSCRRSRLASS